MIDYVKAQFGIDASQLRYKDVVDFFTVAKTESTNLEFKSNNADRKISNKIYRTICAMLNSSGGLIIWGAPKETPNADGIKECAGDLTPFNEKFKKEDLLRSISDKIIPIPSGIDIYEVDDKGQYYVYLFQIQKSEYSPHQTDSQYLMRLDSETRVAPHYFIEALFRKIKYPDLRASIEFMNITFMDKEYQYVLIQLKVVIKNNSPLQNEEYPEFTISCNTGRPLESYESWPPKEQILGASFRSAHKPLEILYFGKKMEEIFKIGLRAEELNLLKNNKAKLNIFLRFGGRYSPLKYSFYSVDTSFFDRTQYDHFQSYPIPAERIESLDSKLVADADFDMDIISGWNTINS